eukprot:6189011-Pleurochrysis_carterae.AAC.2
MHAKALQLFLLVVLHCTLVSTCPSWCAESRTPLSDCNKIACSHCAVCDTIDSPKCTPALELDTSNERCLQGCNVKPNQLGDCRNCACKRCPLCLGWTDPEPVPEEGLEEPDDEEGVPNVQYPPPPPTLSSPPPPCVSPPPPPPVPVILPVPTSCLEGLKLVPNINNKPGWCSILTSEMVCVEHFAYNNTGMGFRPQPCKWIEGKCLMRICILPPPPPPPLAPPHPASPSPRAPQTSPTPSSMIAVAGSAADASAAGAVKRNDAMLVPDREIQGMADATSPEDSVEQSRPEITADDGPAAYDGNLLIYAPMITATLAMTGLCLACFAKLARGLTGGTGRQLVSHGEEDDLEEDDDDFYDDDDDDDDDDGEQELIAPQPTSEKSKANQGHRPNTRSAYEDE